MLQRPTTFLSRALCVLALALLASCMRAGSIDEVTEQVRSRFPDVPAMTVDELAAQFASGDTTGLVLLDARGEKEFAVSQLPGALHAPNLESARAALSMRPHAGRVVVYCSVGARSARMVQDLIEAGHTGVYNLEGSIFEWANRGLPVLRDGEPVRAVHPYNRWWQHLLAEELRSTRAQ